MIIREIEEKDLPSCAEVYAETFSAPPWHETWAVSEALHRLQHFYHSKGFIGLLLEDRLLEDKQLCSFVLGNSEPFRDEQWFYLREMCTKSDLQGKGYGSRLMAELATQLKAQKVSSIYLITDNSFPAARFYGKHHFRELNEMDIYIRSLDNT